MYQMIRNEAPKKMIFMMKLYLQGCACQHLSYSCDKPLTTVEGGPQGYPAHEDVKVACHEYECVEVLRFEGDACTVTVALASAAAQQLCRF